MTWSCRVGSAEVPSGEEGLPISSVFSGNFCWNHVGTVNLGICCKADGQDMTTEGFGAQSPYRKLGLCGEQDLRCFHRSQLLVFIPLCTSSHQLWAKVKRWMHETSARAWCTGKTQRDQVEWEVGGGIGMGNTCKSMADSYQCMTKPTTIL